jgi:hypothetical protein
MIVAQVYIDFFASFVKVSFIPGFPPPRGGVTGRLLPNDGVLAFFSDGFKIYLTKSKRKKLFFEQKFLVDFSLLEKNT